ncbi:MAG: dynamin family protein, partial [Snowella sp.]|nr:dynamin family protein [Snowella sp.]
MSDSFDQKDLGEGQKTSLMFFALLLFFCYSKKKFSEFTHIAMTTTINVIELQQQIISKLTEVQDLMKQASKLAMSDDFRHRYTQYENDIHRDRQNVESLELKMAIIAPMSAGKSTIINAIVAQELLPVSATAMTAIPTEIVFSADLEQPHLTLTQDTVHLFQKTSQTLQKRMRLLGNEGLSKAIAEYPHLKDLANRIQDSLDLILQEIKDTTEGIENINKALYLLNHIIRLFDILSPKSGTLEELDKIKNPLDELADLPRINTPFLQDYLTPQCQGIGNLIIIDTPGPNEEDISSLFESVTKVLQNCSIILLVLDFTGIKNEAAEKIKKTVHKLIQFKGEDSLYVLVNKIDQRSPDDPMTSEKIREFIAAQFNIGTNEDSGRVFEISGNRAFCASKFRQERKERRTVEISELKTAKDLAYQVYPIDWKEELREATLPQLDRKAIRLWDNSGFTPFIEKAINNLLANTSPRVFKASLNSAYNRLLSTKNDFATLLAAMEGNQAIIEQEINQLSTDSSNIECDCKLWQEAIDEILKTHLTGDIGLIFDQMLSDKPEVLTEVRNITNKSKLEFDNQEEAQDVANDVSRQIQQLLDKKLENVTSRIEGVIGEVKGRLDRATKEKLKPDEICLIIRTRLKQELNIDISFDIPEFKPSIQFDAKEVEIDKVNLSLSIWGKLHNTFIT